MPRHGRGLLPLDPARGGLLGRPPEQDAKPKGRSVLDRILGLYGADPSTHIPAGQALGRGLGRGGRAAAAISGRGHDRPTFGQHISNFMGAMQGTGAVMGAERQAADRKARIQAMVSQGDLGPQQMQAIMMELVGQGDYEGAGKVGEVLKTMLASKGEDRFIKSKDPIYDTLTEEWIYPDTGAKAEPTSWQTMAHPETGEEMRVPIFGATPDWTRAVDRGESDASRRGRHSRNVRGLVDKYNREIQRVEPSFRLTNAALGRVDAAKAGDGSSQLALLYGFIRALDPNSVVREGEVRLAREAAPLRLRAIQLYNDIIGGKGAIMAPEMADMIASTMRTLQEDNSAWLGGQRRHYGGVMSRELLGRERMDLFRDPMETLGASGVDPLAGAGQSSIAYSDEDYEKMLKKRFAEDEAAEAAAIEEGRAIWDAED